MGVVESACAKTQQKLEFVSLRLSMDSCTLIPRTILGVVYPAYASLNAALSETPERFVGWLRYWVVLGVFSVVELLLDPLLNPYQHSFPAYFLLGVWLPYIGMVVTSFSTISSFHFLKSTTKK